MIKVNNKKAVRNLANKSFKANRMRNIIAVIAIALTSVLLTSLFTMGAGTAESIQQASIRQSGGDGHAVLKYITDDEFNAVKSHPIIKQIAYCRMLTDKVENTELIKRNTELWYYDDTGLKLGFCEPTAGHKPQAENEVIADTKTLRLLGVPLELGAPVILNLKIRDKTVTRSFVLCGWWQSDPGFNIGQIFTSRAYVDAHADELYNSYKQDYSLTGCVNAYIMFKNSMNLESKLEKIITESGFSSNENDSNYVESNVNWAYLSTNFNYDAGTLIGLLCGLLLIIFAGYLIIYNIFQISIIQDIRFYGLLKTIGTTKKQIRLIIKRQALILSAVGIPIGLVIGFFAGKFLVPLLMSNSSYAGSNISVSPNPIIFAGSALFALFTVIISTIKPAKIAASVSPVEAVKYTDNDTSIKNKVKNSKSGAKMHNMALGNMGRNKKRTSLVVISLSLSLILLNTVITLSASINMDRFLSKFNDTDFLIAHSSYFQNHFTNTENELSEQFISAVKAYDGFEDGGRLYGGTNEMFTVTDGSNTQQYNRNTQGDFFAAVYGLEDLPFNRLELLDGELDKQKLLSGKYILEGVPLDDHDNPEWGETHYKVGDVVTMHNYKGTSGTFAEREYTTQQLTVLGHVAVKTYTNSDRTAWSYTFYLPSDVYKKLVARPVVMSYAFNVSNNKENEFEAYLKMYTDKIEPVMNYDSKATTAAAFSQMRNTVLMVGGSLGIVIGIIGILNFINAILTSIITRRKEFAMLESMGMTRKQLRFMLCYEGLYYSLLTTIVSLLFGIAFSVLLVQKTCQQMWFMSYSFIVYPLVISIPIIIILGVIIPLLSYCAADKQSIVERLREAYN